MVSSSRYARYWGAYVAGGIALALIASSVEGKEHSQATASNTSNLPPAGTSPKPYVYPYPCAKPQSAEQDNLCIEGRAADASRESARWAKRTFWIGVPGLALVLATFGASVWAAWAAWRSAKAAESAAKAALLTLDRPWLYIENLRCVVTAPRVGVERLVAGFKVTNHGKAPAVIRSVKAVLFYSPGETNRDVFPAKPLPDTMLDFPANSRFRMLIAERGHSARKEIPGLTSHDVGVLAPILFDNGIVVGEKESSLEFMFNGDRDIRHEPGGAMPIEHAGRIYLIGFVSYVTPIEEVESLYFCFEAEHAHRQFRQWGSKPFNERVRP